MPVGIQVDPIGSNFAIILILVSIRMRPALEALIRESPWATTDRWVLFLERKGPMRRL